MREVNKFVKKSIYNDIRLNKFREKVTTVMSNDLTLCDREGGERERDRERIFLFQEAVNC